MSPKRGKRVAPPAPPPGKGEYDVLFECRAAEVGWKELGNKAPGNTFRAWHEMRTNPAPQMQTPRHHQMDGDLAYGTKGGETFPMWQLEVTGGGRIWYLLDEGRSICWVKVAGVGHPKATD